MILMTAATVVSNPARSKWAKWGDKVPDNYFGWRVLACALVVIHLSTISVVYENMGSITTIEKKIKEEPPKEVGEKVDRVDQKLDRVDLRLDRMQRILEASLPGEQFREGVQDSEPTSWSPPPVPLSRSLSSRMAA